MEHLQHHPTRPVPRLPPGCDLHPSRVLPGLVPRPRRHEQPHHPGRLHQPLYLVDAQVQRRRYNLVGRYLSGADRDLLDLILDVCVLVYREQMDEDGQVVFKGKVRAFLRACGFLGAILPYTNAEWEKPSIFLTLLVPKWWQQSRASAKTDCVCGTI